jgi:hypothetical protein
MDGLAALAKETLAQDPFFGTKVFRAKRADRVIRQRPVHFAMVLLHKAQNSMPNRIQKPFKRAVCSHAVPNPAVRRLQQTRTSYIPSEHTATSPAFRRAANLHAALRCGESGQTRSSRGSGYARA